MLRVEEDLLRDLRAGRYVTRRIREGATAVRSSLAVSKRDLLLFDALVITNLEAQLNQALERDPNVVADIEFLSEQGFVFMGTSTPLELVARLWPDLLTGDDQARTGDQRLAEWLASAVLHPSLREEEATSPWPMPSAAIVEAMSLRLLGAAAVARRSRL